MSIITGYRTKSQMESEDGVRFSPAAYVGGHFEAEAEHPLDLIEGVPPDSLAERERSEKLSTHKSASWHNISGSGLDVVQAIQAGDSRFMDALIPKIARLKPPYSEEAVWRQTKRRRKRVRGDYGNELDIHEARQGRIDRAWTRTRFELRDDQDSRHVNLVINCSLHCGIDAIREADWRSAAVLAIYDELVRAGKSVAIYMMWTCTDIFAKQSRVLNTMMVPVKRLGEQMSQYHVASYVSAAFTRNVMMYCFANLIAGKRPGWGYGIPQNVNVMSRSLREMRKKGMYVIYMPHAFCEQQARQAVEDVVRQAAGNAA